MHCYPATFLLVVTLALHPLRTVIVRTGKSLHFFNQISAVSFVRYYTGWHKKNGNFWKPNKTKTFLWRKHAVARSTDPWLLNGEVVCSSRSLFRSAANCTWLPLRISKVPIFFCVTLYSISTYFLTSSSVLDELQAYTIVLVSSVSSGYFKSGTGIWIAGCRVVHVGCRWINCGYNVYWTVHHCNSWRMKDQLDVTCYFTSLLMCSTCFGH